MTDADWLKIKELYRLCKVTATWFVLDYSEVEDNWCLAINSAAPAEELYIKDCGWTYCMDRAINHLKKLAGEAPAAGVDV